jgi:hypothetical protein
MDIRDLGNGIAKVPGKGILEKPLLILKHAHSSAKALLAAFDGIRGKKEGAPTDAEQDLLRSMLVLSAAGLDSIIKQLIRDTLTNLAEKDVKVLEGIEAFARKQMIGMAQSSSDSMAAKFLAQILVAKSHHGKIIELYIEDLTSRSLQSAEELMKALYALAVEPTEVGVNPKRLKEIFDIRNKIIHELDIQFGGINRSRNSRTRNTMVKHTNLLLALGEGVLLAVARKL